MKVEILLSIHQSNSTGPWNWVDLLFCQQYIYNRCPLASTVEKPSKADSSLLRRIVPLRVTSPLSLLHGVLSRVYPIRIIISAYLINLQKNFRSRRNSAQGLLHTKSESPNGKFGFHTITYNGDVPQENGFANTWEEFFINGFKHMLNLNIERGGPWEEMNCLEAGMLSKVIPRLLRPMETRGRTVKPVLVHGDLWCGNAAVDTQTGLPLIYDPASFYAHNECKEKGSL